MSTTTWTVNARDIVVIHSWWTGVTDLYVDGALVFHRPAPPAWLDFGLVHRFDVAGFPCALRIVSVGFWFRKELLVGVDAETVSEASRQPLEFPIWLGFPIVVVVAAIAAMMVS